MCLPCEQSASTAFLSGGWPALPGAAGPEAGRVRALVVDDDEGVRGVLARILDLQGLDVNQADSVAAARRSLAERPCELVLCDVRMPKESGHVLLEELAPRAPDVVVIMVTAGDDVESAVAAMKGGAYDYVRKPFTIDAVEIAARRALERRQLELENRAHRTRLEELVQERTVELRRTASRLTATQSAVIWMACLLAESRDGQTGAHLDRMAAYCRVVAESLPGECRRRHGIGDEYVERLAESAPLHDIGKVAIPDSILLKRGPLTAQEREAMQHHPTVGRDILWAVQRRVAPQEIPLLELASEVCLAHHERYDGRGYPGGLGGEAIPLSARIAALADFYDATTSARPYRPTPFTHEQVRAMVCADRGGAFDPRVVDAFLAAEGRVRQVAGHLRDRAAPGEGPVGSLAAPGLVAAAVGSRVA